MTVYDLRWQLIAASLRIKTSDPPLLGASNSRPTRTLAARLARTRGCGVSTGPQPHAHAGDPARVQVPTGAFSDYRKLWDGAPTWTRAGTHSQGESRRGGVGGEWPGGRERPRPPCGSQAGLSQLKAVEAASVSPQVVTSKLLSAFANCWGGRRESNSHDPCGSQDFKDCSP